METNSMNTRLTRRHFMGSAGSALGVAMRPALSGLAPMTVRMAVLAAALTPVAAAGGQQVVEIDFANGRDVINDELRAIHLSPIAIDHGRGALYVRDREEPNGIMVFSLETGEWLRTYRIPRGEGPGELRTIRQFTLAADGGLYVLGHTTVIQLDSAGGFVSSWSPWRSRPPTLCEFGGRPTIAVQGGLMRRAPDGAADIIGARRPVREHWARHIDEDGSEIWRWRGASVACTDDAAFLVLPSRIQVQSGRIRRFSYTGPDSILVYSAYGEERVLAVPNEYSEEREWNRNMTPSLDTHGNLVAARPDNLVPGAVIDPRTECYTVLRHREFQLDRAFLGIYGDSALVFHRDHDEETADGQRVVTLYADARKVTLNPLRRISGPSCSGMLTSVGDRDGSRPHDQTIVP
jgi:hypothetical protein